MHGHVRQYCTVATIATGGAGANGP